MGQSLKNKLLATGFFIDNIFLDQYLNLVSNDTKETGYAEQHHILQKQYFKLVNLPLDDTPENKVLLLYKDHCKAHWLLYNCTSGKLKTANAAAVQYILNVYNELNNLNKTKEELTEADFIIMQQYYNDIKEDSESKYFSTAEIIFLKQNYPKYGCQYCATKLGRTPASIYAESCILGLVREFSWTVEDYNFLIQNYEKYGGIYCAEILHKTTKAIFKQAQKLQLSRKGKMRKKVDNWTEEELNILKIYYPREGGNVYKRLANRSYNACRCMASILKIKRIKNNGKNNDGREN